MKPQDKWADISAVIYGYEDGGEAKARQAFADAIRIAREEGRREGFEKAREMAAGKADARARTHIDWGRQQQALDFASFADDIRAMRDGAGEDPNPTARCRCGKVAREHDDTAPWACAASGCAGFRWQARP